MMGTAADDLRDIAENMMEDHLLGLCLPEDCPYCIELGRVQTRLAPKESECRILY